ncbi:MAG: Nif3-like dinuclear metal center hexameric protein [Candidatus Latescibacteria bacterium]|nr:Nif3-like dinuclear metal center hexameric protein [Candidatus Latescibacterota bacterium]
MTLVRDIIGLFESWAPPKLAESWDNVGLIYGSPDSPAASIIVALDATEETVGRALETNSSLVVTHHPPLFNPQKKFSGDSLSIRLARMLLKNDIALYTAHTNLDRVPDGVSGALADRLGLGSRSLLVPSGETMIKFVTFCPSDHTDSVREAAWRAGAGVIGEYRHCSFTSRGEGTYIPSVSASPYSGSAGVLSREDEDRIEMLVPSSSVQSVIEAAGRAHPYDEMAYDLIRLENEDATFGYGVAGELPEPMEPDAFVEFATSSLGIDSAIVSARPGKQVGRVAVLGGKGSFGIEPALSSGADAFVTGEIGYHEFVDYGDRILLVDAGHRSTELPVLEAMEQRILSSDAVSGVTVIVEKGSPPSLTRSFRK